MKLIRIIILAFAVLISSCEGVVDGINDNPNQITPDDVIAELYLTGAMLANSSAQGGHLNRISGLYSGHLVGFASLYSNIYGYSISTAESNGTWSRYYVGVIPNVRFIRQSVPSDNLLVGISKVLEAHAIGTAASLFGDVPYSEINNPDITDPAFDSQMSVFTAAIALLESAKTDLDTPGVSRTLTQDIYYGGDATKWSAAASTLIARYYLQMKDYANARTAAQNGISSSDGNMQFIPRGDPEIASGDKNLFWMILAGSRNGDIGNRGSYLMQLIDPANTTVDRNNAKTNESARFAYYQIDEGNASANQGIIEQFEPQNLVSYAENLLIRAECEGRVNGLAAGLPFLNEWRQAMTAGEHVNANFQDGGTYPRQYDDYVAADFAAGGIENQDNINDDRAFLREVIEERYVTGLQNYMAFNDIRRLAKSDTDLMVPFPINPGGTQQPQRLPYSFDEINTNANSPADDPGIYVVTEVNQ